MVTPRLKFCFAVAGMLSAVCVGAQSPTATKQVEITDPFLQRVAFRFPVPANWTGAGTILRGVGCGTELPHEVFRASSPDGLTGLQYMPPVFWFHSDNPVAYKTTGHDHCEKLASTPVEIALAIAGTRPGAHVVSVVEHYQDDIFARKLANSNQQLSSASNGKSTLTGQEARITIAYQLNGHAVEEVLVTQEVTQTTPAFIPPPNPMGRPGSSTLEQHMVEIIALRAPRGQLAAEQDQLFGYVRARTMDPGWASAEQSYEQQKRDRQNQQFQRMESANWSRFQAEEARFKQKSAATLENSRRAMAQNQAANDQLQRTGQDQIDFLAGNQYYLNPQTGQTYTINAGDGKTYMRDDGNGQSSVLRTNDAYQQLQMPSDWVELQAIQH